MATPINPSARTPNLRPESEPTAEERFTAKPKNETKSSTSPTNDPADFMERESARDTAQTRPQHNERPSSSPASNDAVSNVAGIESLAALAGVISATDALGADLGDVNPQLGEGLRVTDDQLKALPGKILSHLRIPPRNQEAGSPAIDSRVIDVIDAIQTSASAGQAVDAESVFIKPVRWNPDLSDLVTQIATTPAPSDENAPLSDDIIAPMERLIQGDYPQDIMAFVQWVLRESYLETTHSLRDFANRVRFFNEQKEAVRNELDRVRGILSQNPSAEATDQVGPFESGKFDELYLGSQVEKAKESAAAGETAFKVLELPHLRNADRKPILPSDEASSDSKDLIVPNFRSQGDAQEASSTQLMHEHKDTIVDRFLQWFDGLSSLEQAAVLDYLRTEGLTVTARATEVDNPWLLDDNEHFSHVGPAKILGKNEDLKAFLSDAIGDAISNITSSLESDETEYELGSFCIILNAGELPPLTPSQLAQKLFSGLPDVRHLTGSERVISYRPSELEESSRELAESHATQSSAQHNSTAHFSAGDTVNTKAEAEAYVEYLENRLNTIGDDAQLANVDLQNWLQKQQQTLQMMSTISKQLHDTAMAIIRKMGG